MLAVNEMQLINFGAFGSEFFTRFWIELLQFYSFLIECDFSGFLMGFLG
jgi:hypothetical protein